VRQDLSDVGEPHEGGTRRGGIVAHGKKVEVADRLSPAPERPCVLQPFEEIHRLEGLDQSLSERQRNAEEDASLDAARLGESSQDLGFGLLTEALHGPHLALARCDLEIGQRSNSQRLVEELRRLRPDPFDARQRIEVDRQLRLQFFVVGEATGLDNLGDLLRDRLADSGKRGVGSVRDEALDGFAE
jgi:hypothetical protein